MKTIILAIVVLTLALNISNAYEAHWTCPYPDFVFGWLDICGGYRPYGSITIASPCGLSAIFGSFKAPIFAIGPAINNLTTEKFPWQENWFNDHGATYTCVSNVWFTENVVGSTYCFSMGGEGDCYTGTYGIPHSFGWGGPTYGKTFGSSVYKDDDSELAAYASAMFFFNKTISPPPIEEVRRWLALCPDGRIGNRINPYALMNYICKQYGVYSDMRIASEDPGLFPMSVDDGLRRGCGVTSYWRDSKLNYISGYYVDNNTDMFGSKVVTFNSASDSENFLYSFHPWDFQNARIFFRKMSPDEVERAYGGTGFHGLYNGMAGIYICSPSGVAFNIIQHGKLLASGSGDQWINKTTHLGSDAFIPNAFGEYIVNTGIPNPLKALSTQPNDIVAWKYDWYGNPIKCLPDSSGNITINIPKTRAPLLVGTNMSDLQEDDQFILAGQAIITAITPSGFWIQNKYPKSVPAVFVKKPYTQSSSIQFGKEITHLEGTKSTGYIMVRTPDISTKDNLGTQILNPPYCPIERLNSTFHLYMKTLGTCTSVSIGGFVLNTKLNVSCSTPVIIGKSYTICGVYDSEVFYASKCNETVTCLPANIMLIGLDTIDLIQRKFQLTAIDQGFNPKPIPSSAQIIWSISSPNAGTIIPDASDRTKITVVGGTHGVVGTASVTVNYCDSATMDAQSEEFTAP